MNKPLAQALQIVILGIALLIAISVWFVMAAAEDKRLTSGLGIAVCLAGAVGGVANNFRRLQRLRMHNWEELDSRTRWLMTLQIYVSPLIGALFAGVLYIAFMAEILQGSLFPQFTSADYVGLKDFILRGVPTTTADAAKALFWSFVAGFAEGFVPNFIDKVAQETSDNGSKQATG